MDKELYFNIDLMKRIRLEFEWLSSQKSNIYFDIWTELPENYQRSYYENEFLINPSKETFEEWKKKLYKRPNPIYSVALAENQIISSVYGAGRTQERTMNLWATHVEHRQKGIGKIVLLNFIKYSFESNPDLVIRAWDVSSPHVNNILTQIGFQ